MVSTTLALFALANWAGHNIERNTPTTTIFVLTTIPRSPTTTTLPETEQVEFQKFQPIETNTILDETKLCELAFTSPSGEHLVFELFTWAANNLDGDALDVYYNHTRRLILESVASHPCTETANLILDETVPYMTRSG